MSVSSQEASCNPSNQEAKKNSQKYTRGQEVVPRLRLFTGDGIPVVGLGTWKSPPGKVAAAVKEAIKDGYRHIDCATAYNNESEIGGALTEIFQDFKTYGVSRHNVWVTSKLWNTDHRPEHVEPACRDCLKDLGLDYLDLYMIHWPVAYEHGGARTPKNDDGTVKYDLDVTIIETWQAMEKLVEQGLVRHLGLSNFNTSQIERILEVAKFPPAVLQVECHPYFSLNETVAFCQERNIAVTCYSPLGSGDRKWVKPNDPHLLTDPIVLSIAKNHSVTPAQVLLQFNTQRNVAVVPKSITPKYIAQNIQIDRFQLSDENMQQLLNMPTTIRLCRPATTLSDGSKIERDRAHPEFPY